MMSVFGNKALLAETESKSDVSGVAARKFRGNTFARESTKAARKISLRRTAGKRFWFARFGWRGATISLLGGERSRIELTRRRPASVGQAPTYADHASRRVSRISRAGCWRGETSAQLRMDAFRCSATGRSHSPVRLAGIGQWRPVVKPRDAGLLRVISRADGGHWNNKRHSGGVVLGAQQSHELGGRRNGRNRCNTRDN